MTRDEILKLEAGRETGALVAKHVMGWKLMSYGGHPLYGIEREDGLNEFCYFEFDIGVLTTDIAAAWEVLEKVIASGWWNTDISFGSGVVVSFDNGSKTVEARADTAPLAICRAALLAVMEVKP